MQAAVDLWKGLNNRTHYRVRGEKLRSSKGVWQKRCYDTPRDHRDRGDDVDDADHD